jgi:hypothetical protein
VNGRTATSRACGRGIPRLALRLAALVAFLGTVGCGNECETGDLDVMLGSCSDEPTELHFGYLFVRN